MWKIIFAGEALKLKKVDDSHSGEMLMKYVLLIGAGCGATMIDCDTPEAAEQARRMAANSEQAIALIRPASADEVTTGIVSHCWNHPLFKHIRETRARYACECGEHACQILQSLNRFSSLLGAKVADVIGDVAGGIENAPVNLRKVNWKGEKQVEVVWKSALNSDESADLAQLLIGCSRRGLRMVISAAAPGLIRLTFSEHEAGALRSDETAMAVCAV